MAAFQYRVTHLRTFRNNRRYNEGEIIDSDMVIVSRGMAPNNEATRIAVAAKRDEITALRAKSPEALLQIIAELRRSPEALMQELAAMKAKIAKYEAEEKAKAPPIPPATPAPTQQQSRRADR